MWTYNVPWNPTTQAGRRGVETRGLTSVSVAHHHLDFYGLLIGFDLLRLWKATGRVCWRDYAVAMIVPCRQLIATVEDPLDRSPIYAGWQPEQIYQTRWNILHRFFGTKGRFGICAAWVVVLTLGALFDIRRRFPEILDFELDPAQIVEL